VIDAWLVRRAAAGDQAAFATLIESSRGRIHALISTFVNPDIGLEREDAYQLVCVEAWRAVGRGQLNPHHGDFYAFLSRAARHRLITYVEHLRAEKRWTGQPPASIDTVEESGVELGSWVTFVDPLRVVLARDELRRCWAITTARQRAAIGDYMRRGGKRVPARTMGAVTAARRKVRPMLEHPYGLHPTLQVDRTCRHCGRSLAGVDIRATVHRECREPYRWQRQLAEHARERTTALRLV